jgi:hypothetical protein
MVSIDIIFNLETKAQTSKGIFRFVQIERCFLNMQIDLHLISQLWMVERCNQ